MRALPLECFYQTLRLALDFEDLDCAVAGAGCQFPAVVVQHCIMLRSSVGLRLRGGRNGGSYDHVIVARVGDDLGSLKPVVSIAAT